VFPPFLNLNITCISTMATKFEGWTAHGTDSIKGNLKWEEYKVKDFQDDDVERAYRSFAFAALRATCWEDD
jgi:hypothetical protein